MRHVVVHGQLTRQASLHQPRHRAPALPPTESRTLPDASGDELERSGGDLLTRGGDADDAGFAPAAMCALQRRAHHLHVARAVERVVHAPLGHVHDDGLHRGVAVIGGAQAVRAPELGRDGELVLVEVHADDARRARHLRRLHDGEADGAEAENRDGRPRRHLARVPHRAQAGGHAASEEARLVQGHASVDLRGGYLRDDGVFGKGGASHEVKNFFPVDGGEAGGPVGHDALALRAPDGGAEVGLGARAKDARGPVALRGVARDDVIAGRHRRHAGADGFDNRASLVAQNAREEALGVLPLERVHIRVAERVGHHLDADLAGFGRRDHDGLVAERLVRRPGDGGFARDRLTRRLCKLGEHRVVGGGHVHERRLLRLFVQRVDVELDVVCHERADEKVGVIEARVFAD
mmetsp:Transcript_5863/g.24238  ORF Transcript_5863/g.24238 Transcript_5863/m.24238 type:complete len:407 (+) Transcript_5863:165-1385(+)